MRDREPFPGTIPSRTALRGWSRAGPRDPPHGIRLQPRRAPGAAGMQSHPQTSHHPGTPEQERSRSRSGQHGVGRSARAAAGTLRCRRHGAGKPTRCPGRAWQRLHFGKAKQQVPAGRWAALPAPGTARLLLPVQGPVPGASTSPRGHWPPGPGHGQLPVLPNEESVITARDVGSTGGRCGNLCLVPPGGFVARGDPKCHQRAGEGKSR